MVRQVFLHVGIVVWQYLEQRGFLTKAPREQWEMIIQVKQVLEHPSDFFITRFSEKPVLSLLETGEVLQTLHDPVSAANAYYHAFIHDYTFAKEKNSLTTAESKVSRPRLVSNGLKVRVRPVDLAIQGIQ